MKLTSRLRAAEQVAMRRGRAVVSSVIDRIDELTALFLEHPLSSSVDLESNNVNHALGALIRSFRVFHGSMPPVSLQSGEARTGMLENSA